MSTLVAPRRESSERSARRLWALVAVIAVVPLVLGAGARPKVRPLTDQELRTTLYGNYMQRTDLPGVYGPDVGWEFFCRTGEWELHGGRSMLSGRFTIEGGKVCVARPNNAVFCRAVYVDKNKQYYTDNHRWTKVDIPPGSLARVELTPNTSRAGCK